MTLPLRSGVHRHLEAEANRLLRKDLEGVTKHSEKRDILTPWKQQDRYRKEVYNSRGFADPAIRKGLYIREPNEAKPELNSRDGVAQPRDTASVASSLRAFVEEHGSGGDDEW